MVGDQARLHPVGRARARALGISPGVLAPGPYNAISDIAGVLVGHVTVIDDDDIRTGVTAILPHSGNLFQERVPAGLAVGNAFGKLVGATQLQELGEIETPLLLTNTLAVARAAEALIDWTLAYPGNQQVVSINPLVGEVNDSFLNNIRRRVLTVEHMRGAIEEARAGAVEEGAIGAGTGTVAFGWKGGIGTSSRRLPPSLGGYSVGALVQSNYGGILQIDGMPVGLRLGRHYLRTELDQDTADGSIMIVVATDAPLSDRNLTRVARRALGGLARTGAALSNGSGDYAIAFSTAESVRRTPERRSQVASLAELPNELLSPLFQATIEATEEAIYNSLLTAETICGYRGHCAEALPIAELLALLAAHGRSPGA